MLDLEYYIDYTGNKVGFLIPIFSTYRGSNVIYAQLMDRHDNISSFFEIIADSRLRVDIEDEFKRDVGMPGVWAFRGPDETVYAGDADFIRRLGRELIAGGKLDNHPFATADLIRFCNAEVDYPGQVIKAYEKIASVSGLGADVWRDVSILLPIARQELGIRAEKVKDGGRLLAEVSASTEDGELRIFAPESLLNPVFPELTQTSAVARIYGIESVRLYALSSAAVSSERAHQWIVRGFGGVGRWSIGTSPIRAETRSIAIPPLKFATGNISIEPHPSAKQVLPNLEISIHGSNQSDLRNISKFLSQAEVFDSIKHAINIRPLSFGAERRSFLTPNEIFKIRPELDFVWIIANHRQRQNTSFVQGLAMSNVASRYARATVVALASLARTPGGALLLSNTRAKRGLGLVGATRFLSGIEPEDLIRRALYTMLNEEAQLHTAEYLVCLWPYSRVPFDGEVSVTIGSHRYHVSVVAAPNSNRYRDVSCLAFGVRESRKGARDYADFCVSLLGGWGWRLRHEDGEAYLFEDEGEALQSLARR